MEVWQKLNRCVWFATFPKLPPCSFFSESQELFSPTRPKQKKEFTKKANFLPLLNQTPCLEYIRGTRDIALHTLITTALIEGEQTAPCPMGFTTSTHWIWSWVGPRASLDPQKNKLHFNTNQVITSMPKTSVQKNILNVAHAGLNVTPEKKCLFISAKNS